MPKAKAHPDQVAFDFSIPAPSRGVGELAGLGPLISETIGTILNTDPRDRWEIAAAVSKVLRDDVSKMMLDAYASPARVDHKVPFERALAIAMVCDRQDLLDPIMRKIGVALLVGDEVRTARLGQVEAMLAELQGERQRLKLEVKTIRKGDS